MRLSGFFKDSSSLRDTGIFPILLVYLENLIGSKCKFYHIQTYLWTRKSALNLGRHPDLIRIWTCDPERIGLGVGLSSPGVLVSSFNQRLVGTCFWFLFVPFPYSNSRPHSHSRTAPCHMFHFHGNPRGKNTKREFPFSMQPVVR